jgi:hypothetical protein
MSDPISSGALSMIGLPSGVMSGVGEYLPGLGAPAPGIDAVSAAAATAAVALANNPILVGEPFVGAANPALIETLAPRRRIRITQKA